MSSLYNGVAPNVSLGSTANITIPADGDTDSAATVNVPFQKGADYLEALRQALFVPPAWGGSTAYTVNQIRSNSGNAYIARVAGTSAASGGPTTTVSGIVDGTVTWDFICALSSLAFFNQPGGAAPGIAAEGGATGPGVFAIAGGGAAPARGAANLNPQAAPSAPANGDLWTTAAALFARINGATKTQAVLETAQTFTQPQTLTGSATRAPANLVPQTAPSAPADGDVWITTTGIFARVNGATIQLLDFGNTRVAKAWGYLTCGLTGAVTVTAGFNVASASYSTNVLTVNFTSALPNANYCLLITPTSIGVGVCVGTPAAGSTTILGFTTSTGGARNWAQFDACMFAIFN